jgi:hypothetical protein
MRLLPLLLMSQVLWAEAPRIQPRETMVPCGQVVQFRIPGREAREFRWQADKGTVDEAGRFTAPQAHGTCVVTATEWQDVRVQATAEVRAVEVRLQALSDLYLRPGEESRILIDLAFKGGEFDRKLEWVLSGPLFPEGDEEGAVLKPVGAGPDHGGRVDATGWIRAPRLPGEYAVKLTLLADPRVQHVTSVHVQQPRPGRLNQQGEPLSVVVSPARSELPAGHFQSFNAIMGSDDLGGGHLVWSLVSGPKEGELSQDGTFHASQAGTYRVRATSWAYPQVFGEAEVEVKPSIAGVLKEGEAMKEDRVGIAVLATPEDRVILVGGWNGTCSSGEVVVLDLESQTLRPLLVLQIPRSRSLATVLTDGTVLVVGGIDASGRGPVAAAERFDATRKASWQVGNTRWPHIGGVIQPLPGGRALLVGGVDTAGKPCGVELFDGSGSFRTLDDRPWPAHAASVQRKDGRILILGGELDLKPVALIWQFDPGRLAFTPIGKLAQPRSRFTATLYWDEGEVIAIGGRGLQGSLASIERLDLARGISRPGGRLAEPRERHAAILIPTGQVMVFGGGSGTRASRLLEDWSPDQGTAEIRDHLEGGAWLPFLHVKRDGGVFVNGLPESALSKIPFPPLWERWN